MAVVYFASDFHLKSETEHSKDREQHILNWLESISDHAAELYLVGDVFDFWFDYKKVIPRGYTGILSALYALRKKNIPVHFFTGNHDLWMFDYFTKELDIPIYKNPIIREIQGKKLFIGHGDGLGPGDHGYKLVKKLFTNPLAQRMFRWLHPDVGIGLANYFSSKSREAQDAVQQFLGPEKEWLIQFAESHLPENDCDYYIFGHRHLPIDYLLSNKKSRYINLGDWISFRSYASMEGGQVQLNFYKNDQVFPYS